MRKLTLSALAVVFFALTSVVMTGKAAYAEQKNTEAAKTTTISGETKQEKKSFFQSIFGSKKDKTSIKETKPVPEAKLDDKKAKEQETLEPSKKEKRHLDSKLREVERIYWAGTVDDAEAKIDDILRANPKDEKAAALKDKIKKAKERIVKIEAEITEAYYSRAELYFSRGNNLEASLEVQRAMGLDPTNKKIKKLYDAVTAANQKSVDSMMASKRKKFRNGFKAFLEENFQASADIFRDLQKTNPEVTEYLSEASAHLIDQKNRERSSVYFADAVKSIDMQEFKNAQEYLYQAVEMDKNNLEARLLLEQVKIELGL